MFIIAGPCVVESKEMLRQIAGHVKEICVKLDVEYIFKASYRKANRSSISSFTGIGDEKALNYLAEIGQEFDLPVITDIHFPGEAALAAQYVDMLQIPAFLSRQTDLLLAAGKTGKTVNIKKGQFLAPDDMKKAADKVESTGNKKIWLTERGTAFGYHDLIVDFRSLMIMKELGYPVVFDATHSLQKPSVGVQSGGAPEYIPALARAAAAVGIDGLFMETHPDPANAKSDAATQMALEDTEKFIKDIVAIDRLLK
ncbi:MAG: 3-deoxy-8-phosphooctulonate synthase [Candidatus Kapabacteria bacterium]|jgi:2-dehydro-3-deoxyphosphooctonate aldolase (KDO 8-P synthase)|nr:3-deoxy-8-phosphooctulonate synthase [Candidatus Kapabacteria bacterium]